MSLAPQLPAHLVAIETGHHDVQQHEVRWALLDTKGGDAIERNAQLVLVAQGIHQDVDVLLRIVDDQHAAFGRSFTLDSLQSMAPAQVASEHRRRRNPEQASRIPANLRRRTMVAAPPDSPGPVCGTGIEVESSVVSRPATSRDCGSGAVVAVAHSSRLRTGRHRGEFARGHQQVEGRGDALLGGLHVLFGAAVTNALLQGPCRELHVRGPDVARHSLECVREAFCCLPVACCLRLGDTGDDGTLVLDEGDEGASGTASCCRRLATVRRCCQVAICCSRSGAARSVRL